MGLNHPEDLELWRLWQAGRRPGRRARHALGHAAADVRARVRPGAGDGNVAEPVPAWTLSTRAAVPASDGHEGGRVLIVLDAATPTVRASLLTPLPYLTGPVQVLAPEGLLVPEADGPGWEHRIVSDLGAVIGPDTVDAIVSIGQHLDTGERVHRLARARSIPQYVVQHGVLTPFTPPLPRDAILLAWSEADGRFWSAGRRDVGVADVGSQLLWQAGHDAGTRGSASGSAARRSPATDPDDRASTADPGARPVFLGQIHGAELSRRVTVGAAMRFCREHGALYRPHPAETDLVSRAIHAVMRRRGIEFATDDVPLAQLDAPVAAVFSTGILEAAARGLPAWAYGPHAPGWVHELWDRYGMRRFGGSEPTPAPRRPDAEPAASIARVLEARR